MSAPPSKGPLKIEKASKGPVLFQSSQGKNITVNKVEKKPIDIVPSTTKTTPTSPIQIQSPAQKIQIQPPATKISIEKPTTKGKIQISRKPQLTLEEVLKMKHNISLKNDERYVQMHDQFTRYRVTISKKPTTHTIPDRSEQEKLVHFIQSVVNKLNLNKYTKLTDQLTEHKDFMTTNFLKSLADVIHSSSQTEQIFSNLYSLLCNTIASTLSEDASKELLEAFKSRLIDNSKQFFAKEIPADNEVLLAAACSHALFLGCLTMREVVPVDFTYQIALKLVQEHTKESIDVVVQLLKPCGALIDKVEGSQEKIYDVLHKVSTDRSFPGRVRFNTLDFLEIRTNKWEGIQNTFPQIYSTQNAAARKASTLSGGAKKEEEKPKLQAGKNKFAGLMDDDDEDEAEVAEPFNAKEMVETYIVDSEIIENFFPEDVNDLFLEIAQYSMKQATKAIPMLSNLKETSRLDDALCVDACRDVYEKLHEDIYSDLKDAHAIVGRIFGRLCGCLSASVDDYNKVFEQYRLDVVIAFLTELFRMKKLDMITESRFWMDLQWRGPFVSHRDIVKAIDAIPEDRCREAISKLFPLYDALTEVMVILNDFDDANEEDSVEPEQALEEIKALSEEIIIVPEFAIGVFEILIELNDPKMTSVIAPLFAKSYTFVMKAFEVIYTTKQLPADTIESYYGSLNQAGIDVMSFLNGECPHEDPAIVQLHKELKELFEKQKE